jgi:hypothetical protein
MKNLFVFLIVFYCYSGFSQDVTPIENALHVYAPSGLNLRAEPHAHSKIIDVVDYGEKVRLLSRTDSFPDQMGWVPGHWVKVHYEGAEGYLFDGYLSSLDYPSYDFELCSEDMDLIYPLESYMDYHFFPQMEPDTSYSESDHTSVTHVFHEGYKMKRENKDGFYKLSVELPDTRIMDAYHLIQSMLTSKAERLTFMNNSIFIENPMQEVVQIKVKLEHPINIKKLKSGKVRISLYDNDDGCSL